MRNYQRFLRRCERLRMRRKAKRLALKKNGYPNVPTAYRRDTANEIGWMAAMVAHLLQYQQKKKGVLSVDKDKERHHQDR